ncbi:serine/threonine protein kinase [Rubinisphaera margarita]|uniref:serine/threonine protein kinase n=1 Tax=Rubinisphaera margarita TaxID=2909586 RepID=UPI001EE7C55E|nr:serine/threonine-protein kinase [Rubinisphaera margarita]MCG6157801.1 serine/threonine protein kinase [Rubinisphaera margarita]
MSTSDSERDPLEVLFSTYIERYRAGEAVDISSFAAEHPGHASEIRDLFPTLVGLEAVRDNRMSQTQEVDRKNIQSGLQLGDYQLLREIGVGGMGIVYEALQLSMQRRVALKVLPREFSRQRDRRERFMQEARTVARLSYRNIVPIIDFGESDGRCFFAMRLVQGVGLDWIVQRREHAGSPITASEVLRQFRQQGIPLADDKEMADDDEDSLAFEMNQTSANRAEGEKVAPGWVLRQDSWKQIARIGVQATKALQHAHNAGVLHRDIKPGNLLLDYEGIVWITDFGLAKSEHELSLTGANDVVGTLRYISPERFDGQVDPRSDLYALGLSLIELCINRPVFAQSNRRELMRAIMDGEIVPPRKINPDIPVNLESILLKTTAREPALRYQTAGHLLDDLRSYARGREIKTDHSLPAPKRRKKKPLRKAVVVLGGLCLLQTMMLLNYRAIFPPREPTATVARMSVDVLNLRLQNLDSMYRQITGRKITDDLGTAPPWRQLSSRDRDLLQSLLNLYRQLREDSNMNSFPLLVEDLDPRVALLRFLLT